eukprot:16430744-Heterocapsa_arctica.AAC.1
MVLPAEEVPVPDDEVPWEEEEQDEDYEDGPVGVVLSIAQESEREAARALLQQSGRPSRPLGPVGALGVRPDVFGAACLRPSG